MISFSTLNYEKFSPFVKSENDLKYNKIILPSEFDHEKIFKVRFDDLDTNNHVNNTTYTTWALESLPYEFRKEHSIKNMDIHFKKDVSINETVLSKVKIENKRTVHVILNKKTNEELVLFNIDWA